MKWLFNFSASPAGGGLRRLQETAKWFDGRGGATFLVHPMAMAPVSGYAQRNRYIVIRTTKLRRLIADGTYLPSVTSETGTPDVYFSYGIPLFCPVGRVNWLHASNALTLTRDRHGMPFKRYCELQLLGRRMVHSLRHADIASAESEYALGMLRTRSGTEGRSCRYVVLNNGCEDALFERRSAEIFSNDRAYAVTVGTAPYKRLEQALAVFGVLQDSQPDLEKLKIVGNVGQIPRKVLSDARVEALGSGISNEELYCALEQARYYISTSGIENSSIAAIEGLLLSQRIVLSDIPSHREAVRDIEQSELRVPGEGVFIEVKGARNAGHLRQLSWSGALQNMVSIASERASLELGGKSK